MVKVCTLITGPGTELISTSDMLQYLRADDMSADEIDLIVALVEVARLAIEDYTGRSLLSQTWEDRYDFDPGYPVDLSKLPVMSLVSAKWIDEDGAEHTVPDSHYYLDAPSGRVALYNTYDWDIDSLIPIGGFRIRYIAGYGHTPGDIPGPLIEAAKKLVSYWYRNRVPEQQGGESIHRQFPAAARVLMNPYRINLL